MSKTLSKKLLALFLIFSLLIPSTLFSASAAEITPYYNNVSTAYSDATISSTGKLTVSNYYHGPQSLITKAVIETKVEKRTLGLFWKDVSGGEWIDTIYDSSYAGAHTLQLADTGTYRITVKYTIYGNGGPADVVETELKREYK